MALKKAGKRIEKNIKSYAKYYKNILVNEGMNDIAEKMDSYEKRLKEMYESEKYAAHDVYPSMSVSFVYAVIAMCLELKDNGYNDKQIITMVEKGMAGRWETFIRIVKFFDLFPNSFAITRKWNISDHASRVKDGSITYDYFKADKNKVEYSISGCMYVEMFSSYGIRPLCKIFCNTDLILYSGLVRHIEFVRHSDLSDGCRCFDEVIRRK